MKIASHTTYGDLHFIPDDLPAGEYYIIPGSKRYTANEDFARVFYQEYETKDYSFWMTVYHPKQDTTMHIHRGGPWTGFRLVLKNHIKYTYRNGDVHLKQGQFMFTHLPIVDSIYPLKKGQEYQVFDMWFDLSFINRTNISSPLLDAFLAKADTGHEALLTSQPANSNILLLDAIEYLGHQPGNNLAAQGVLQSLVGAAEKQDDYNIPEYKIERMYEARDIIRHSTTSSSITNSTLAKKVGTHEKALQRDFAKLFGMPPRQYLHYERIKNAKLLLDDPHVSIDVIAKEVGFSSANSFSTSFKRETGLSPSDWRKRHPR